jgi:hypothetical protein
VACGGEPVAPPPEAVRLVITASDTLTAPNGGLTFTAVALDSAGAPVAVGAVQWSVSDTLRGRITATGVFTGGPLVGRVTVYGRLATPSLADSVAVRIVPPGTVKWTWPATAVDPAGQFPTLGGPALGADGTVYVLVERTPVGQLANDVATLVALTANGVLEWTLPVDSVVGNYPVVTPTGDIWVAGKQVYVVHPDGGVRWQVLTEARSPEFISCAVSDALAFVAAGYHLTVFGLVRGDTVWQSPLAPFGSWVVPPTVVGSGVVYAKHTRDTLFAFRQSDGAILKTYQDPDSCVDNVVFGAGTVPVGPRF